MSAWKDKLMTELSRDWRRTLVLGVLLVIGVVMVVRNLGGDSPQPVQAFGHDDYHVAGQATAVARIDQPGASAAPSQVNRRWIWQDPARHRLPLPLPPARDPFVVDLQRFPPDPLAKTARSADINDTELTQEQREQMRLAQRVVIEGEAASLNLQTILMTQPPRVMINGDIYSVGNKIRVAKGAEPFELVRIDATSAVLQRDGFEVILKLE